MDFPRTAIGPPAKCPKGLAGLPLITDWNLKARLLFFRFLRFRCLLTRHTVPVQLVGGRSTGPGSTAFTGALCTT